MNSIAQAAGNATAMTSMLVRRLTASAAARTRIGRRRFPPAKTLWRIAALSSGGHAGGTGSHRSSAASTRARTSSMKWLRESAGATNDSSALGIVSGERPWRGLQLAPIGEDLNPPLGLFEARVAEARQLDTSL